MNKTVSIYNQSGEAVGEIKLNPSIFGVAVNPAVVHQVVVGLQAQARKVIADTKGRGEVRGGGKKPWKQKGTGRARHGSTRSPIWRGGGVTFGPTSDENYTLKINKKVKKAALLMSLSDKAEKNMTIVDSLDLSAVKTKAIFTMLQKLRLRPGAKDAKKNPAPRLLLVIPGKNETVTKSVRNIAQTKVVTAKNISVLDVVTAGHVVFAAPALEVLEQHLAKSN